MSTTTAADRALFSRLVDDAAVFPPAALPLERALGDHLDRRGHPAADLVGPLLVPVAAAAPLRALLVEHPPEGDPLRVGLIARPGTPADQAAAALQRLRGIPGMVVTAVEVAADAGWTAALRWDLPLSVEVPRDGERQRAVLAALAGAAEESLQLQAKLRTQATATAPPPDPDELAGFVTGCVERGLPFKLTGGLHHAVRGTHRQVGGAPEDQHGVLNVALGTRVARGGGSRAEVAEVLRERDAAVLAREVAALDADDAAVVRATFTSFGCCAVHDPITELARLGLISDSMEAVR